MRAVPYAFNILENCRACNWKDNHFFCDLDAETLKEFEGLAFRNIYPPGAMLFAEGQTPRGIFLLCRGSVKLSISADDGKTVISHIATSGEVLGLSATITGNPYRTTAETLEPTQINFVRREDFVRLLARSRASGASAMLQLSHECELNLDHIRALGLSHSAAEKLANVLLKWCDETGKPCEDGTRVQLLMTHEDISQLISTSRETVSRLLKEFRERKILSVRGSTLIIHDRAALQEFVM